MKEKTLKILNMNYWQENSPMRILSAEYIQQNHDEDNVDLPISLTIQNISNQIIVAAKGTLRVYDIFKDYLDEIQFKWTNFTLESGKTKESAQTIKAPNATVHLELVIEQVVFNDYSVYDLDNDSLLIAEEISKEYFCTCGALNPNYNQTCHKCGLELTTENTNSSMSRFHDRLNSDEKIIYADASLGKIHLITNKNRVFAYGSNDWQQANPDSSSHFISSWEDITESLKLDYDNPIVSIQGRIAITQNGRFFTWGLSDIPDDINPFTHNGLIVDPLALNTVYEYLLPKYSELSLYEFKISQNFEQDEIVIEVTASSDFMVIFLLTNKQRVFYWSYNIDRVMTYEFNPYKLIQLKKTPKEINDLTISENTLLMFDDENVFLYGHNYLKLLFEGQYNNYSKKVYIPELSFASNVSGVPNVPKVKNVVANKFYKAFIIQYEKNIVFYMGYTKSFYCRHLVSDKNYKTGKQITEIVSPDNRSIKRLFFQRLALSLLIDNTLFYWGIISTNQIISFKNGLDITNIFPLNEEEKITNYFTDPGKVNSQDDDSTDEYDQYFITSENRLFAAKFNDFIIAAEVAKTSHFKIREIDIKI